MISDTAYMQNIILWIYFSCVLNFSHFDLFSAFTKVAPDTELAGYPATGYPTKNKFSYKKCFLFKNFLLLFLPILLLFLWIFSIFQFKTIKLTLLTISTISSMRLPDIRPDIRYPASWISSHWNRISGKWNRISGRIPDIKKGRISGATLTFTIYPQIFWG